MSQQKFQGFICATATPFGIIGSVDHEALRRHMAFMQEKGAGGILANGTTGEFYSLTREERRAVFTTIRESFSGTVISHVGGMPPAEAADEARWSADHGADGILCLLPSYPSGLPAKGIAAALGEVQSATELPFLIYNFPIHTGNDLTPEILRDVEHVAVKDSSANLDLIAAAKGYLVGGDRSIEESWKRGGHGFVSAGSSALPEYYAEIARAIREGDGERVERMQLLIARQQEVMGGPLTTPKIKYALSKRLPGYPEYVRAPQAPLPVSERNAVDGYLGDRSLG